ncbi:MAG: 3-oxoacyl-[acyl-carrier-protein] synthase 2 [Chlamydiia bacterium]|nr:3-oxoacyl-[acyl-carrier-protein] synthase 2 [Chlamydiia bacterium]
MKKKKCVITGMGLVSCFGSDKQVFYQNLLEGNSGVTLVDVDAPGLKNLFGAPVTGFNPEDYLDRKRARRSDPAILFAIGAAKEAVKDAALDIEGIDLDRAGVLIGTGIGGMHAACNNLTTAALKDYSRVSPFFIPHLIPNMPGAMVSIELGFKGPVYSISTACATSNYSLLAAKRHIEYGDCDVMLSGGVEAAMNAAAYGGFTALHALSRSYKNPQKASRPFDKNRDGFVMGEGAAVFVLESEEHALKRGAKIYATLSGGAINSDAYHMTNPRKDGSEVAKCIDSALKNASLTPDQIDNVNVHATSTPAGDLCELRALQCIFGKNNILPKINCTKSMVGHGLGASGGLELAAIVMAMETGKLHPTINLDDPEEEALAFDLLTEGSISHQVEHAISNSFGFGGHNSVIVISKY